MREYFLKTGRVGFSLWAEDDIGLALTLWGNPEVTKYICASGSFSSGDIEQRLSEEIDNRQKSGVQYWPVFYIENGGFLGCCGLRPYNAQDGVYELGIHLRPEYWGKGLASEAGEAAVSYALGTLKAKGLFAGHHPGNAASAKMLKKLGFSFTRDEYYQPTGLNHPSYFYCP